jgi:hypothetical protein
MSEYAMARVQFIQYKDKKILHLDFSGCKSVELATIVQEAKTVISTQPHGSVRTLTDVTDTEMSKDTSAIVKDLTSFNKPYVIAAAVVGVIGLKKVIYNAIVAISGRNMSTFDTIPQAKDWLATQ